MSAQIGETNPDLYVVFMRGSDALGDHGDAIARMQRRAIGSLWSRVLSSAQQLDVVNDWLVGVVDGCTCAGGGPETGWMHEPYCGWEPLRHLTDYPSRVAARAVVR